VPKTRNQLNVMTVHVLLNPTRTGGTKLEALTKLDAGKFVFGQLTVGEQVLAQYDKEE
jgi:hypothetical protein